MQIECASAATRGAQIETADNIDAALAFLCRLGVHAMKAPVQPEQASEHLDDRLLFLVRAHARLILVEAYKIDSRRGP